MFLAFAVGPKSSFFVTCKVSSSINRLPINVPEPDEEARGHHERVVEGHQVRDGDRHRPERA